MIVKRIERDGYIAVELEIKDASLASADKFKAEMTQLINFGDKYLVVDFAKVDYVDSSFLGALVSVLKLAMTKGSDVAVANLNRDISSLFKLIRMDKVFKVYDKLPDKV